MAPAGGTAIADGKDKNSRGHSYGRLAHVFVAGGGFPIQSLNKKGQIGVERRALQPLWVMGP